MTPCKPFAGRIDRKGYGRMHAGLAHKVLWEREHGPVPEGLVLDHLCHVASECAGGSTCPHRACVELTHLTPTTNRENVMRGNTIPAKWAARTCCEHCGGELTPCPRGRVCRPCRTARSSEDRRVRKARARSM